jgi:hypothetical protein
MRNLVIFFASCVLTLLISCSSTKITSSWVKPGANANRYHSIMVLALVGNDNPALQQKMEDKVVSRLRRRGYNATSFFAINGPHALDKSDEQNAQALLKKNGADAVFTIVMLDTSKEHHFVPGATGYTPYDYYYNFWGYYGNLYDRIYMPGYYTTATNYFWETNFYGANDQQLIYSVRTKSFNPTSANSLADEYGHEIINDMVDKGILRRKH